jgi:adenylate cyclase
LASEIVEAFLKARMEFEKMSAEGIANSLRLFREIIVKAPDFALGHAWYAGCLVALGWWGNAPIREVYTGAKQLARQAVALDARLGEAHQPLAVTTWILDWDLAAAEREFRRAIELSPSDPCAPYVVCDIPLLSGPAF